MRVILGSPVAFLLLFCSTAAFGEEDGRQWLNEWTQDFGAADHNNYRPIKDIIETPVILWHAAYAYGVPAVKAGEVFLSGEKLVKADLKTGRILKSVSAADDSAQSAGNTEKPWEEVLPGRGEDEEDERTYRRPPPSFRGVPVIAGDLLITTKNYHILTAFSLDLEGPKWELDLAEAGGWRGNYHSPAYANGVLVACGGIAVGVDVENGKVLWTFTPEKKEGPVSTPPALSDDKAFFCTERGGLIALDYKTGKVVWRKLYDAWFGWTSSTVVDGKFYIGDRGGRRGREREERGERRGGAVNAFDISTGERVWMTPFGATGCSAPGVGPGIVFTGHGSRVSIYDMKTGKRNDEKVFYTASNPFGSPTLVGDSLIFGNLDGHLYVFDFTSGKLKWRFAPEPDPSKERYQVHGFAYLECGIILVTTTNGVFAIGSHPSGKTCPQRYILRPGEPIVSQRGVVVGTEDYANGLSVFNLKYGEESVKLETNVETLKFWLRWSRTSGKPVDVIFKHTRIGSKLRAWLLKVSPVE
jgi:outer membrane protein assembly factor BamB